MAAGCVRAADPADAPAIAGLLHAFNVEFDAPTPPVATLAARREPPGLSGHFHELLLPKTRWSSVGP
jgi:hypothetical protein